jgi:hypothetical protein
MTSVLVTAFGASDFRWVPYCVATVPAKVSSSVSVGSVPPYDMKKLLTTSRSFPCVYFRVHFTTPGTSCRLGIADYSFT